MKVNLDQEEITQMVVDGMKARGIELEPDSIEFGITTKQYCESTLTARAKGESKPVQVNLDKTKHATVRKK